MAEVEVSASYVSTEYTNTESTTAGTGGVLA